MKIKLLAGVLALQCAWILGTAFTQERSRHAGQVVLLEATRVDPRDLLRGDYVTLNYEISEVSLDTFKPAIKKDMPAGAQVFVAVAPGANGFYQVMTASLEPFTPGPGQVLLQGRSRFGWNSAWRTTIWIDYGLETFYVSEGTGNPRGKLTLKAVVPASGRAAIQELFVDGVPYAEAMKKQARSPP